MSLRDLLPGNPEPTKIGDILLDCVVRESHPLSSQVTENPVEEGANIADHIIPNPRELVIDGIITNTPARILGGQAENLVRGDGLKNYAQLGFEALEKIYTERKTVTVQGRFKKYTDMAMVSAPIDRGKRTGKGSIRFTATFRQIRKVAIQTATFRDRPTKKENAKPQKNTGKQTPAAATPAVETHVSGLQSIVNFFGGN